MRLEHAISEKFFKIDEFLGRPRFDPHGNPIPSKGGVIQQLASKPLSNLKRCGCQNRVNRRSDKEFLHLPESQP